MRNALSRPTVWSVPTLFDSFFNDWPVQSVGPRAAPAHGRLPALDVWEQGERLFVQAEVPGFRMEDLTVSLHDDTLTLEGRRTEVKDADTAAETGADTAAETAEAPVEAADARRFLVRERAIEAFTRVVRLPFSVNAEEVSARLDEGVLHVELPKAEQARSRRIEVRKA